MFTYVDLTTLMTDVEAAEIILVGFIEQCRASGPRTFYVDDIPSMCPNLPPPYDKGSIELARLLDSMKSRDNFTLDLCPDSAYRWNVDITEVQ